MKKLLFALAMVSLAAFSCKSPNNQTKEKKIDPIEQFKADAAKVVEGPLDLSSLTDIVDLSGAGYIPGLVNTPQHVLDYKGNMVWAAANLGVYKADLLYLLIYEQKDDAYTTYASAKSLARELGIAESYEQITIDRLEGETASAQDVIEELEAAYENSGVKLKEEERARIYTAMLAGNYIEKMYLLFNIIFEYPEEDMPEESKLLLLRQMIVGLNKHLQGVDALVEMIEKNATEDDPGYLLAELKNLQAQLAVLKVTDNPAQLQAQEIFENKELLEVFDTVKGLRSIIVAQ